MTQRKKPIVESTPPSFRSMAQTMAEGLARKASVGLSDADMIKEMLTRAAKPR